MKKPHSYYCHRTQQSSECLPKGYEIIDKIGQGAFGEVYKVFNIQTSSIQVIKRNKDESSTALMNREGEIMSELENSDGFAKIKVKDKENGCLVMTLLGQNLQDLIDKSSISLVDMKRIAYQCILRLKELHDRGFVHRDLKPENILMGNQNNPHKIYMVDFGLASTFKASACSARQVYNGQIGTIKFCPLASHYGLEQFPKDDLQSLGYLLIYVATKQLPWSGLSKEMDLPEKYCEIKKRKENTDLDRLCQGVGCLKKYFKAIRTLKVGTPINYNSLLQIFKIQCKEIYCYSFCKSKCFAKMKESLQNQISQEGDINLNPLNFERLLNKNKIQSSSTKK